jgi:hypothetical protein
VCGVGYNLNSERPVGTNTWKEEEQLECGNVFRFQGRWHKLDELGWYLEFSCTKASFQKLRKTIYRSLMYKLVDF